jgi:branched-chain amino acid transport system permease protein
MAFFLQNVVNAMQYGSFYALIALGYSMVYGVLLLFNFAHGDIFMTGAYIGFFISTGLVALAASGILPLPGATRRVLRRRSRGS